MNESFAVRTQRLLLRDFVSSDFEAVHAFGSDPEVTRYMFFDPRTREQSAEYLERVMAAQAVRPRTTWEVAIIRVADNALIGACDVTVDDNGEGDLGYILARGAWGHGYASEAAARMVQFGFEELQIERIYGFCHAAHTASRRVLEKAGLQYETTLRGHRIVRGESWDLALFSITAPQWRAAGASG